MVAGTCSRMRQWFTFGRPSTLFSKGYSGRFAWGQNRRRPNDKRLFFLELSTNLDQPALLQERETRTEADRLEPELPTHRHGMQRTMNRCHTTSSGSSTKQVAAELTPSVALGVSKVMNVGKFLNCFRNSARAFRLMN